MRARNHLGILALFLSLACPMVQAQSAPANPARPVSTGQSAHLSASATAQVQQDWLVIRLTVQKEGASASLVQTQLKNVMASALSQAQVPERVQNENPSQALQISTGQLQVSPRYSNEGKMSGWIGVAELMVQGRDFERITALAGRLSGLTVSQVEWKISPELLAQTETKVQGQAVAQWRAKADALTQQLGFSRYTVGEVTLGSPGSGQSFGPRAMPMAMMDASPDARGAPIPVQAGLAQVTVVVSGHVLLQ